MVCHAADTASLATWILFGKLIGVATHVAFGEKRCRKNLPLADTINRMDTIEHAGRHIEIGSFHILGPAVQLPTEPNRIQSTIERILTEKLVDKGFAETKPVVVGLSRWETGNQRIAVVSLASDALPNSDESHSRLTLCWLIPDLQQPIIDLVRNALNDIDWNAQATEWNITP